MSQKKTFEFLDPDLKALDPRKLLKKDGCMEKVKMKTNLERLRTINYIVKVEITILFCWTD